MRVRRPRARPASRPLPLPRPPSIPMHTPLVALAPLSPCERGKCTAPPAQSDFPLAPFAQRKGRAQAQRVSGVCACVVLRPRTRLSPTHSPAHPPSPMHTPLVALAPLSSNERGKCTAPPAQELSSSPFRAAKGARTSAASERGMRVRRPRARVRVSPTPSPPPALHPHAYPARFTRAPFDGRKGLGSGFAILGLRCGGTGLSSSAWHVRECSLNVSLAVCEIVRRMPNASFGNI